MIPLTVLWLCGQSPNWGLVAKSYSSQLHRFNNLHKPTEATLHCARDKYHNNNCYTTVNTEIHQTSNNCQATGDAYKMMSDIEYCVRSLN